MQENWKQKVLDFWFREIDPKLWFESTDELDATILRRFGALHERLAASPPAEAQSDADAALAAILVLDQFSRNMFRGTARAFASDTLAASLARNAVARGFDAELPADWRRFLYMPLMHSEVLADQEHCVALFSGLPEEHGLKHAEEHRDIVARFGRFPHRNRALERPSTPDERDFLDGHKGFGQ